MKKHYNLEWDQQLKLDIILHKSDKTTRRSLYNTCKKKSAWYKRQIQKLRDTYAFWIKNPKDIKHNPEWYHYGPKPKEKKKIYRNPTCNNSRKCVVTSSNLSLAVSIYETLYMQPALLVSLGFAENATCVQCQCFPSTPQRGTYLLKKQHQSQQGQTQKRALRPLPHLWPQV